MRVSFVFGSRERRALTSGGTDAFYASCHELGQPELKGTAFAVGGGADGSGGVLTVCSYYNLLLDRGRADVSSFQTASYEARKFGCRSAMAGFVAKKYAES